MDDRTAGNSSAAAQSWPAQPVGGAFACPQCGQSLPYGTLACPHCGGLVYRERLQQLSNDALALEQTEPARAAMVWQQALALLPRNAPQYAAIYQRIGALAGGWGTPVPAIAAEGSAPAVLGYQPRQAQRGRDALPLALAKTGGSMLLSILIYTFFFHSFSLALGFVLLILVHELGHVVAMWYYGLSASPPIFIPFVGALINLRQSPPNAKVEAIVGIGGPLAGTLGALVCYSAFLLVPALHTQEMFVVSVIGFFLNFFNLLPMPPLDGGRITAAVSPWAWIVGLVGLIALIVRDFRQNNYGIVILVIILFNGLPRLRATLRARGRDNPYYRISRAASWTIGLLYVGLAGGLFLLLWHTNGFKIFFG